MHLGRSHCRCGVLWEGPHVYASVEWRWTICEVIVSLGAERAFSQIAHVGERFYVVADLSLGLDMRCGRLAASSR